MTYRGVFVGLTTLDLIYLSDRPLASNQKLVAQDYLAVAGGPATNAAVAFKYLGNQSQLVTVIGQHPATQLIMNDLQQQGVDILDLLPEQATSPPISSIVVTSGTGERAVISINALKSQVASTDLSNLLKDANILLIDGHQPAVSLSLAKIAHQRQIPVVIDGGSWKPGFAPILPYVDYGICSANFYPPNCSDRDDVIKFLSAQGINKIAITQGEKPIIYWEQKCRRLLPIEPVSVTDTLGAGDVFHGAFCHYLLKQDFPDALTAAAQIAAKSCQAFGTRAWMDYR